MNIPHFAIFPLLHGRDGEAVCLLPPPSAGEAVECGGKDSNKFPTFRMYNFFLKKMPMSYIFYLKEIIDGLGCLMDRTIFVSGNSSLIIPRRGSPVPYSLMKTRWTSDPGAFLHRSLIVLIKHFLCSKVLLCHD